MFDQILNPNNTYTNRNADIIYRSNIGVKQGVVINVSRENHLAQTYDVQDLETGALFLGCKYQSPTGGFNGVGKYAPLDEGTLVTYTCTEGIGENGIITGTLYTEGNYSKYYSEGKLQEFAQLEEYSNRLFEINQPSGHPNRITDPGATATFYGTNNLFNSFSDARFTDNIEDKAKANRQPGIIELSTSVGDKVNYAFNSIINYTSNIINVAEGTAESKCAKLVDFANYYNRQADLLAQTSIISETTPEEAKKTTGIKPIVSKQSNAKNQSNLKSPFTDQYFIEQYKKLAQLYLDQAQSCNRGDTARQLVSLQMQISSGSELPQGEQSVEGQQTKPNYKPTESNVPINTKPRGCKYKDATQLIQVENGIKLHSDAAKAFVELKKAAQKEGINIILVSGFRSIAEQQNIIDRKRKEGQTDSQIFKVNSKPGFSEHHTGYSMDLDDGLNKQNLKESFEQTDAFKFIQKNAAKFGLELSYPKGNSEGIDYEPWHWRFVGNQKAKDILFCSTSQTSSGIKKYKPIIVIHETISSKEETIKLIQANPNIVSYHVIISLSGEITYLIPSEEIAKAGNNASFNGESINNSVDDFAYHIALETPLDGISEVTQHSGYTDSQYYSLSWLTAKTEVPLDRIVLHKDIDLKKDKKDPRSFDRAKFEKLWNNYPKTKEIFFGIEKE